MNTDNYSLATDKISLARLLNLRGLATQPRSELRRCRVVSTFYQCPAGQFKIGIAPRLRRPTSRRYYV